MNPFKRSAFIVLTVALALTIAACEHAGPLPNPDTGGITRIPDMLVTNATRYESGSVMTIRLTNRTARAVGYNLCRSAIELENEGDWRPTQPALAEACTAEIRTLRAGQSVAHTFRIVQRRRGQYRISTDLEDLQTRARYKVVSNPFTLTRDEND